MSDYTSVNYAAMETAQTQLRTAHAGLVDEVRDLERKLETQLASWEGDAVTAYREAQATWNSAIQHMAEVIERAGSTVGQISGNYQNTDASVARSWG